MILRQKYSGTGCPAVLSISESEALLNRLERTSYIEERGGHHERQTLYNAVIKLRKVVSRG